MAPQIWGRKSAASIMWGLKKAEATILHQLRVWKPPTTRSYHSNVGKEDFPRLPILRELGKRCQTPPLQMTKVGPPKMQYIWIESRCKHTEPSKTNTKLSGKDSSWKAISSQKLKKILWFLMIGGLQVNKVWGPEMSCCEICTRCLPVKLLVLLTCLGGKGT